MACCRTAPVRQPAAPPTRSGGDLRELQSLAILPLSMPLGLEQGPVAAQQAHSVSGDRPAAVTLQLAHVRIQA